MGEFWKFSKNSTTDGEIDKTLVGGKGAGLIEMSRLGLPVPPGFIIPTSFCADYSTGADKLLLLNALVTSSAHDIQEFIAPQMGLSAGTPVLVSVRSGARVSMPGMMDTILNVGLTNATLPYFIQQMGERAAYDSYRRLIRQFGQTVMGINPARFDAAFKECLNSKYGLPAAPKSEQEMSTQHMKKLVEKYLAVFQARSGYAFPQTLESQLFKAIGTVFGSWNSERASAYRKLHNIPYDWYTACVIQAMVFGNLNDQSCSGVLFSRNPSTGERAVMGEFLPNAQGEEVVSGSATPRHFNCSDDENNEMVTWAETFDSEHAGWTILSELLGYTRDLESHYKDMVDIEFTVQNKVLWLLQVRAGKRSAYAAFKIAYDLVAEKVLTQAEALARCSIEQYNIISNPVIDPNFKAPPVATGIAASKGIATGKMWLTAAKAQANPGGILVSKETTPDDFSGMSVSAGVLTQTGGGTSHAAVVTRAMDKACVVGCGAIKFNGDSIAIEDAKGFIAVSVKEGDEITIDGSTGKVWFNKVPLIGGVIPSFVDEMIAWGEGSSGHVIRYQALKHTLPPAGEIVIDCRALTTSAELLLLYTQLAQLPELHGILSFQGGNLLFDDSKLLNAFALSSFDKPIPEAVQQMLAAGFDDEQLNALAKRWVVLGNAKSDCRFRIHRVCNTLSEFLGCDQYYEVSDDLKNLLNAQGCSVNQILGLMKASGKTVKPITESVPKESLVLAVLKK